MTHAWPSNLLVVAISIVDKQKATASQNTFCHHTTQWPSLLSLSMLAEARDDPSIVSPYNQNK